MPSLKARIIRNSIIAIAAVILFNFAILAYLNFPSMALFQLKKYSLLLILLISGFGFQVGLFTYLKHKSAIGCSTTVASGGISSISMILCCSHYLVNFVPILGAVIGFSAASSISSLANYTWQLLTFGIVSNIAGILIMLYQAKEGSVKRKLGDGGLSGRTLDSSYEIKEGESKK